MQKVDRAWLSGRERQRDVCVSKNTQRRDIDAVISAFSTIVNANGQVCKLELVATGSSLQNEKSQRKDARKSQRRKVIMNVASLRQRNEVSHRVFALHRLSFSPVNFEAIPLRGQHRDFARKHLCVMV
jgi:hypothetical protein